MAETHNFQANYLHAVSRQIFMAVETPRHIADTVAGILVNGNLSGHDSHGVLRITSYLDMIANDRLRPKVEPEVIKETDNTFVVNAGFGFGHYTAQKSIELAIDKAKRFNVVCASLYDTSHIGRLGEYLEVAARAGCISIVTLGNGQRGAWPVVPFGGAVGGMSTNPIAIGCPTGDDSPFVADIATSVIAEGKLRVARSKGVNVPEGHILDKHGNPTVNTMDFYDGGSLLPFGGHKGYALSLVTCLLGGLSEEFDIEKGSMGGVFMQVINVEAFTPLEKYQQAVRAFLDDMKATPPAPGFNEVLVPGDFEHRCRNERLSNGIDIPDTIHQKLREHAADLNVSLGEEIVEPGDIARYQVKP